MQESAEAYKRLGASYQDAKDAFAAVESAHGRGAFNGPEAAEFQAAVDRLNGAMDVFRRAVERDRREAGAQKSSD